MLYADKELLLGEAQRLSLHVCEGEVYEWTPYELPREPLAELCVEAQLLEPPAAPVVVRQARAALPLFQTPRPPPPRGAPSWLCGLLSGLRAWPLLTADQHNCGLRMNRLEV